MLTRLFAKILWMMERPCTATPKGKRQGNLLHVMAKEQKTYTKEFKVEAVRLVQSGQKSQAQIAHDLGVADSTLSH